VFERLRNLMRRADEGTPKLTAAQHQGASLELAERDARIRDISQDLDRERSSHRDDVSRQVTAHVRELFEGVAPASVQLALQRDLAGAGRALDVKDIVTVGGRLLAGLADAGLEFLGHAGEEEKFDIARHQPTSAAALISTGAPVRVRVPGAAYKGTILVKVVVEPVEG
jgi:hypothetical protein